MDTFYRLCSVLIGFNPVKRFFDRCSAFLYVIFIRFCLRLLIFDYDGRACPNFTYFRAFLKMVDNFSAGGARALAFNAVDVKCSLWPGAK